MFSQIDPPATAAIDTGYVLTPLTLAYSFTAGLYDFPITSSTITAASLPQPAYIPQDVCMIRTKPDGYTVSPTYTYFITDNTILDATSVPPLDTLMLDDCTDRCSSYRLDVKGKI